MTKGDIFIVGVITICIGIIIWANTIKEETKLIFVDCSVTFDTVLVTKDWTRGAYPHLIRDSIILSAGYKAFDTTYCHQSLTKKYKPFILTEGVIYYCDLGDLYPPFKIYKKHSIGYTHCRKE
ncbi:hypothetical protein [Ekhidna sp.]|uniref:hypothetical protein n=1 Tax=Ekhidna sp. TaxID=2608089 RepID=UPI003CCB9A8F